LLFRADQICESRDECFSPPEIRLLRYTESEVTLANVSRLKATVRFQSRPLCMLRDISDISAIAPESRLEQSNWLPRRFGARPCSNHELFAMSLSVYSYFALPHCVRSL